MSSVDVIVAGAGVIGMLTARELQARGLSVVVVERDRVGRASSWAGGGILAPIPPWGASPPVMALATASQQAYPSLAAQLLDTTGVDIEYERSGVLQLGVQPDARALAWAHDAGQRIEALEGVALRECEPELHERWHDAARMPDIAQVRNPRLMQALHRDVVNRGIAVYEDCAVEAVSREGSRVTGVQTSRGRMAAGAVVLATGAWTGQLADVEVRPVRGQMLWYQGPPGLVRHILIDDDEYLIPRRDGVCLVGSTVEHEGFEVATTEAAGETLRAVAARLCPALAATGPAGQWAGLRPGSGDGVPAIGPFPGLAGLFVNAGHFRNGLNLAPASACLLADLLTGVAPAIAPGPYGIPNHQL